MTLGEYRQGDQVLPILLKDNTVDSFRINDLRTLPVFGTGNETTSLEQVVSDFDFQYRFSNVKDYNRQMVMMAQCDPRRGVNAIAAFNQVWSQVQKEIKVPEGYTMKYFGEQESQVESNEALAKNLPLTFFLMFVTLLFLFKTYRKPTVILLMLPVDIHRYRVRIAITWQIIRLFLYPRITRINRHEYQECNRTCGTD